MKIRRSNPLPLYYQLKNYILDKIENNEWATGDIIPSETELSKDFSVSRATVRQAILELVQEGYLHRIQGKGTVVTEPKVEPIAALTSFSENMRACGIEPSYRTLEVKWVSDIPASVLDFNLNEKEKFLYIHRLLLANGEPISIQEAYIPQWVIKDQAHLFTKEYLSNGSLYQLLSEKCGVELWRADESLDASVVRAKEAGLLEVSKDKPVLIIRRCTYDGQDRPIEYVKMVFRADRYRYRLSLFRKQEV